MPSANVLVFKSIDDVCSSNTNVNIFHESPKLFENQIRKKKTVKNKKSSIFNIYLTHNTQLAKHNSTIENPLNPTILFFMISGLNPLL